MWWTQNYKNSGFRNLQLYTLFVNNHIERSSLYKQCLLYSCIFWCFFYCCCFCCCFRSVFAVVITCIMFEFKNLWGKKINHILSIYLFGKLYQSFRNKIILNQIVYIVLFPYFCRTGRTYKSLLESWEKTLLSGKFKNWK